MQLLLEADPSEECIKNYIKQAWCFVARDKEHVVAACIAKEVKADTAEIFNIAVDPTVQAQGIGTRLLTFTLSCLKNKRLKSVELGTGTFGYQLAFYQRQGFRVESIVKDFFIDHYDEQVIENGIKHKDMLRLVCSLSH
ncbi:acetyltransferase [Elysia marginata]|uniref:Acetyltransferase n=1 Tax=Elysia marginata TaxID=1093978 RepID=A0AAV4JKW9_9GAST|nr:acetyltransferase [Elysia marginata]